jgi:hypothetical protein
MRDFIILFVHVIVTVIRLAVPGDSDPWVPHRDAQTGSYLAPVSARMGMP